MYTELLNFASDGKFYRRVKPNISVMTTKS